jgi:aspartyl-tRNA(Asn)/glutamyl-tRNA(Gln) amidotransferase subunit C
LAGQPSPVVLIDRAMSEAAELDVAYIAALARINLTQEETQLFQKQLGDVLKYAAKLREIDVSQVEVSAHAIPVFNVFREDESRDWLTAEQALSNAPRTANNLFIVTKVVE